MAQFPPSDNTPPMGTGNGPNPAPPASTDPTTPPMKMPEPNARIQITVGMTGQEYADLMESLQQAGLDQIAAIFQKAVAPSAPDENSPENLADEINAMGAAQRG